MKAVWILWHYESYDIHAVQWVIGVYASEEAAYLAWCADNGDSEDYMIEAHEVKG
jgi:hypothetical protein